jgi:hypothetical protein
MKTCVETIRRVFTKTCRCTILMPLKPINLKQRSKLTTNPLRWQESEPSQPHRHRQEMYCRLSSNPKHLQSPLHFPPPSALFSRYKLGPFGKLSGGIMFFAFSFAFSDPIESTSQIFSSLQPLEILGKSSSEGSFSQ